VGPHTGVGEECEDEGVAEITCDELITAPIPCHPALLGAKEDGEIGVKFSLGRREA